MRSSGKRLRQAGEPGRVAAGSGAAAGEGRALLRIRRIRMVNFRSFRDFEVDLDPGLNLVVGPNESGKSTIVEGLAVALFTDPAPGSLDVHEMASWGTTGATRLELSFEHDGVTYELLKDFGDGRVELREQTSGRALHGRSDVDRRISEMVGFGTLDAFESVAAVRQGELAAIEEKKRARGELVPMVERKMTSSSGVIDAASVLERLDAEISRMRSGIDRPAPRNPGPLSVCRDRIEDLEKRIASHRETWASVVRTMSELSQDRESLERTNSELARLDSVVRKEEKARELENKLAETDRALEDRESRIGKIRKLRKDIADAWERIGVTTYGEEKRAIVNAKADLDAAERRVNDLKESAPRWAGEGSDRRAAVVTGLVALVAFLLVLAAASGLLPDYRLWLLAGGVAAAAATAALFRRTMRVWAFSRSLRVANTERQKSATVLTAALSTLGFPNYLEFEHKIEDYDRAQRDAESARAVLTDICGTDDPREVEETLESQAAALGRKSEMHRQELAELGGARIGDVELDKLRTERDSLAEEASALNERIARREWELGQRESEDSLPELIARLEMSRGEENELLRRLRVLELAREGLDRALGSTKKAAASVLEPVVERILSRITLARYTDVIVRKDLGFSVANAGAQDGVPDKIGTEDLSTGTVDQLYLAIRYALLEFLSEHEGAPFILDDALVNSDPERRSAALELLHEISDERQVIMLSCENHGQEFADRVISLPAVNGRSPHGMVPSGGVREATPGT
ncbi:MAG: AAA family ATPase [Candidatus Eisenbacteria bacterium]|nr:AAA family ATPase [Candidatus Eisenbacteria bacterium]